MIWHIIVIRELAKSCNNSEHKMIPGSENNMGNKAQCSFGFCFMLEVLNPVKKMQIGFFHFCKKSEMWYCVAASAVAGALGAIVAAHFVKVIARLLLFVAKDLHQINI